MTKSLKRLHPMPFGAEPLMDGNVRFKLWAPAAKRVDLCLTQPNADSGSQKSATHPMILPMTAETNGWFALTTDSATIGTRYRFRIDNDMQVPDPASRFQPEDVHGPSEVIEPRSYAWQDDTWRARPWEEAVIYELHVGSFTPQGSFAAVAEKLDYLLELGITAIELMPSAEFPGKRNWGYDGVYLFAPNSQYGRPEDLKALVDAAHARGLMVFLDVVYNHFGPEGNYLHLYAPQFFTERHITPWGAALNFDGEHSDPVRQFFIHNALYWLEEYHLDGLRFDAVHAIVDDSQPHILTDLAQRVHEYFGINRHIHLILENDHNDAHYLARDKSPNQRRYNAQWNDDIHHVLHVLLTGESSGYYIDYADNPTQRLGRCLTEGFAYQGERSVYRDGQPRGESSRHLPITAFVSFLQNHDQVGNRAFGDRLPSLASPERMTAAIALLLLAPSPPLLFMGEEWGCIQPFMFFCDFGPDLAEKVVAGRRQEFARFPQFSDAASRERIPNPMDTKTFEQAVLDWDSCNSPAHRRWLDLYRELLALRQRELFPRLHNLSSQQKSFTQLSDQSLSARWVLNDNAVLILIANLGDEPLMDVNLSLDQVLFTTHPGECQRQQIDQLPPWSVIWTLQTEHKTT